MKMEIDDVELSAESLANLQRLGIVAETINIESYDKQSGDEFVM